MLNQKAIEGLLKSAPEKRYKSFLTTAADREEVWGLLAADETSLAVGNDGCICLWPYREFCELMMEPEERPGAIEIHDFLEWCEALDPSVGFNVFPTRENAYVVSREQLCTDMQKYLDEVE